MASQKSTPVKIPATQAHRHFGDLIRRVYSGKEHFVVEKDGLPVAAIISVAEYEEILHEREVYTRERQARLKRFEEIARQFGEEIERQGITEEELNEKVDAIRQELYDTDYGNNPTR